MMQSVIEALKLFGPASVRFLILALAVGVVLAFLRRTERAARWYFAVVLGGYWILASPACAERLLRLEGGAYRPLTSATDARGARTVVVLGAGNFTIQSHGQSINQVSWQGALRVLESARLYPLLDRPTAIDFVGVTQRDPGAASEADAMRTAIVGLGVAPEHVVIEAESKNTRDEARIIGRMLAELKQPIVLVTSPSHMTRSLAVFRAAGLDPIPSVSAYKPENAPERYRWAPSDLGLARFAYTVYDGAAGMYYRARAQFVSHD